ncbi:hypothetical protein Tsubulata_012219 [Turnera subulata]|uniref:Uncharacterized protein n=1 Tax=Turnera subulata TaxID=218843 RepID=A0A9Q0FIX0_9ROSI|nr:hypothetical protein Tsubulata_012219 [Turnera subulata]
MLLGCSTKGMHAHLIFEQIKDDLGGGFGHCDVMRKFKNNMETSSKIVILAAILIVAHCHIGGLGRAEATKTIAKETGAWGLDQIIRCKTALIFLKSRG